MNAVFNIRYYEALNGKIETFDPAAFTREKARQRAAKRCEIKRRIYRLGKLHTQRKLGVISLIMGTVCIVAGKFIPELYTIAVPFLMGGFGLCITRKIIT